MASSSSAPVGPPLQPSSGEGLEAPPLAPAASTEAMVDAPMASSAHFQANPDGSFPPPSPGEAEDPQEGFAAPLLDPWYTSSPLFPSQIRGFFSPRGGLGLDGVRGGTHGGPSLGPRSCNMFRDTEALRELLRRWCPSTHTFFFSWGELTPTLEDVANHWMLPILGEYSFSNIKLSAAEEEIAAVLKKYSSTRLSGWPSTFINYKKAPIRRAAFHLVLAVISVGHCFPLAPLFLGHLYSQLNLLHDCEIAGDSCFILSTVFNTSALQTFFWEHSTSYIYAARDRSAAWGKLSDLPQKFLDQFPSFRDNLPLVYRWAGLKPRDHDLVEALDYEENVLFRPYGDDHPGFTCASIFRKLYGPTPLIRDLKAEDYRSLSYLSTVNPGFLPVLSATGVSFIPYCPQRSSAFARWGGESTRVLIPGGHRFGFNTPSMGAYWQRLTRSMVDYVIAGRSQKLGFAEWDSARGGWVAYTIHLPDGWRSSVNVVEDRLIMPSKRGKVNKRDAPTDPVFERTPKKSAPTASSSKKASFEESKSCEARKTRAGKESKSTPSVPSTAEESTEAFLEEPIESTVSPAKKTKVGKESKSTTSVPLAAKESMAAPVGESGQKKASVSSSTDEEEPSAAPTPSPPKKKKFTAPLFPLGAAGRTRSKSGPKVVHGSGGSGGDTVVVEDSDVAEEDIDAGPPEEDAPSAAAVDQTEDLGKSAADSPGIGIESMGEDLSSSSGSLFGSAPDSMPEEQIVSAESTADDEDMPEADDSSVGAAGSMDEDLAIVPHAGHDDDSAVEADVDPISFSLPQPVLTSTGPDTSIAHVMEGISLFGVTPSLRAIPAGGFVIPAGHFTSEDSPVVEGALMPEEIHAQGLVESGSVVDLGHDAPLEGAGASAVDALAGSDHLENIAHVMESYEMFDSLFGVWVPPCLMSYFELADVVILIAGDDDSALDPTSAVLKTGPDTSIAHVMEGISLFGVTPSLRAIPAGGFVIPAGHFTSEDSPVVEGALMPEEIHAQGLVESGSVVDLGHDAPLEGAGASAVDALAGSDHLENIGVDDAVHVSEEIDEVGITGEVTVVSPPRRPTIEVGSSIDVSSLSGEVAAFLREFDARAPNPHPEQFFWSFNGPLVPFGDFWVPNDCSPYLSRLSAGHSDFTKGFKLSIGLGGPMMSLLGSVLAAMDESSLEDVSKTQILAWRSVIQDLMDVGFDLGFMMERLRQMAQCVFGKRLTDEIKALQHQIALLQDSLAKLTAYQDAMMSTGEVVPRSERGGSFLDSLLD
uniref:Aminotransferase-like plant mobile domain-containing protein n=1 Tax=Fagus sylvatica TaxID=28930 RepID=A0A2N9G4N7_FAGSY